MSVSVRVRTVPATPVFVKYSGKQRMKYLFLLCQNVSIRVCRYECSIKLNCVAFIGDWGNKMAAQKLTFDKKDGYLAIEIVQPTVLRPYREPSKPFIKGPIHTCQFKRDHCEPLLHPEGSVKRISNKFCIV